MGAPFVVDSSGNPAPIQLDGSGNIPTSVVGTSDTVAQNSTTSGQGGVLIQGAVTTTAPTYTTAKTNPLSLTTAGAVRTDSSAVTQPVSSTTLDIAQGTALGSTKGPMIQGSVTTAAPTYTTGQIDPLSITVGGGLRSDIASVGGTAFALGHQTATGCIPVLRAKGTKAFTAPAPTNAAALALAANTNRIVAAIVNNGTQTVYLGKDNTVTTSNGIPLPINTSFVDEDSTDAWWAIVASGTGDLRIVEVS